ncbi:60S ribosomal protein L21 [Nosema granulosis]|uniref:60S ribosomal protein L21 n=1 Tax=Nosema granulosis TaxID=83296 RepID=A0A9P6GZZ4_9MICR|nr:60S ribosomal protein L21 [Nosema granulosis]
MSSHGFRRKTRQILRKSFRKHGMPGASKYLQTFKMGDYVTIMIDSAIHKGMPHKYYHGRVGRVYTVNPRSIGVVLHKRVGGKFVVKTLFVRQEHLIKFRGSELAKEKDRKNNELIKQAEKDGVKPALIKTVMEGPRKEFTLSLENNTPIEVKVEPYLPRF